MAEQEQIVDEQIETEAEEESPEQPVKRGLHNRGEMIAVCSPKGGVGKTVMAINLAVALSKKNIKIGLLDGDFQFGDVTLSMDLHNTFSIKDLAEDIENIDEFTVDSHLILHDSGVRVLAAPDRPEYAETITSELLEKVCNVLLQKNDYLIVDTSVGFQDQNLFLLEKADQITILTNLEMSTLKNTKLFIETLEILGLRDKAQIVINRSTMESVIQASDVPEILGEENPIFIPNDFQMVSQSMNSGIPFVSNHAKSDIAKAVFKMAELLSSRREISFIKTKDSSFFKSMFRKILKERT